MIIPCAHCKKPTRKFPRDLLRGKKLYCNKICYDLAQKVRIKKTCIICNEEFDVRPSERNRYKTCSKQCLVKSRTLDKNSNWKGGVYLNTVRRPEIFSRKYKNWRQFVFKRDKFTCQHCDKLRGNIEAHHIKPWITHKKLRYVVSNGLTLCKKCHIKVHRKKNNGKRKNDKREA